MNGKPSSLIFKHLPVWHWVGLKLRYRTPAIEIGKTGKGLPGKKKSNRKYFFNFLNFKT